MVYRHDGITDWQQMLLKYSDASKSPVRITTGGYALVKQINTALISATFSTDSVFFYHFSSCYLRGLTR
ncbi:hypothetical protein PT300_02845 [Enterobacteriaceae bacterium ESL0689]|nr:hypothetical protein [Enterobacteriaceae bacterium ESL0689]